MGRGVKIRDRSFLGCPICGGRPREYASGRHAMVVFCKGNMFNSHEALIAKVSGQKSEHLREVMAAEWNRVVNYH